MTLDLTEIVRIATTCGLELIALLGGLFVLYVIEGCYDEAGDEDDAPYEA